MIKHVWEDFEYNFFAMEIGKQEFTIEQNTEYSTNSTDWTLLNLDFAGLDLKNYGIKLIYDQMDTAHADMCFSNIMITHSVF